MGAKGAGNPIGFMGSLSDTLNLIYLNKGTGVHQYQRFLKKSGKTPIAYSPLYLACITLSMDESTGKWVDDFLSKAILSF